MNEINDIKFKINYRDINSYYKKNAFIFTYKKKLDIIKYSKELQKICLVDIEDYKKESGKYKIGLKNGFGKEYIINTNILIFEGEYLNGKRNGKGKEYYKNGKIRFEGEYLNGKKWNGNGYNINGNTKFEIKDGKGNIKEYNYYDGKLRFEGEYLNGERNGKGKEFNYITKLEFEGEYLKGKRNGLGKEYYKNDKLKFEGDYLNGNKWNGNGYI